MTLLMTTVATGTGKPRAVLVSVWLPTMSQADHTASLAELGRLVDTLGYEVVATVTQRRKSLDKSAVLGGGKLHALAELTGGTGVVPSGAIRHLTKAQKKWRAEETPEEAAAPAPAEDDENDGGSVDVLVKSDEPAEFVVVDNEISPSQVRNLERATDAEVLDRTGVIIEIFHRHAHTREARLQVEIARLHYEAPRLREKQGTKDRQRGSTMGGKGQTDLEMDRHRVRDRIAELKKELAAIQTGEHARRKRRSEAQKVALVGYTNAGKSSLMRALTSSEVLVADKLFATLGTTVRVLSPEAQPRVLVSDTVGFIKNLPHDLVASFRSTLDEAADAGLLLFVVDASDPAFRAQLKVTQDTLRQISGAAHQLVLNKIDRVSDLDRRLLRGEFPDAVQLSALEPKDALRLRDWIVAFFERDMVEELLIVPHGSKGVIGEVREHARVIKEDYDERGALFTLKAPEEVMRRLRALVKK